MGKKQPKTTQEIINDIHLKAYEITEKINESEQLIKDGYKMDSPEILQDIEDAKLFVKRLHNAEAILTIAKTAFY